MHNEDRAGRAGDGARGPEDRRSGDDPRRPDAVAPPEWPSTPLHGGPPSPGP